MRSQQLMNGARSVAGWLIDLVLWSGGFVTHSLNRDHEHVHGLTGDKHLQIWLGTNDYIEVSPFCYVEVRKPSEFSYGSGTLIDRATGSEREFKGMVESIIPSRVEWIGKTGRSDRPADEQGPRAYYFDVSDNNTVRFESGKFVTVTADGGEGLWCTGTRVKEHHRSMFIGRIPFGEIQRIGEKEITVGKTLKYGLHVWIGIACLIGFLVAKIPGM